MTRKLFISLSLFAILMAPAAACPAQAPGRITVLVDAFGVPSTLKQDWGFSALVEYGGKRILFDTGNDEDVFVSNAHLLGVDLTRLDAVVISHRHGDHSGGLRRLLEINPGVRIYAPNDEYFGGQTPRAFFSQQAPSLPARMRYFGGAVPKSLPHGSPWRGANIVQVDSAAEIAPGIRLVRNISQVRLFGETPELSLVIDTPRGQVVLVGCSHPGIEQILASVGAKSHHVSLLVGGLHLLVTPEPEIDALATRLRDEWNVEDVAPGHCTGELGFELLQRAFRDRYVYAGVGTVIGLS